MASHGLAAAVSTRIFSAWVRPGSADPSHSPDSCSAILSNERGWVSREDYLDGLALAQLAPGPLAAQLAMYLGYVRAGVPGATIVAICFVLPSFLMVWALSYAYVGVRRVTVDAGTLLRHWRRRDRHHCPLNTEADGTDAAPRRAVMADLRDHDRDDGMDRPRDRLVVRAGRRAVRGGGRSAESQPRRWATPRSRVAS